MAGLFTGSCTVSEPGNYQVAFSAIQASTGNSGSGVVTFLVAAGEGEASQTVCR